MRYGGEQLEEGKVACIESNSVKLVVMGLLCSDASVYCPENRVVMHCKFILQNKVDFKKKEEKWH